MLKHQWVEQKRDDRAIDYGCVCSAKKVVSTEKVLVDGVLIDRLLYYQKGNNCPYATDKRRVLADIPTYPSPQEIYNVLTTSSGWDYKTNKEEYLVRDRALVAFLYLTCFRIKEALSVQKSDLRITDDRVEISGIALVKIRKRGKPRRHKYRDAFLPLNGERAPLTRMFMDHADTINDGLLFGVGTKGIGTKRAWQITKALTGKWNHFFRAVGEDYLYGKWKGDLLAVSDYVKVNPMVLQEYIRKRYQKYDVV